MAELKFGPTTEAASAREKKTGRGDRPGPLASSLTDVSMRFYEK